MNEEPLRLVRAQADHEELKVAELQAAPVTPRRGPGRLAAAQGPSVPSALRYTEAS